MSQARWSGAADPEGGYLQFQLPNTPRYPVCRGAQLCRSLGSNTPASRRALGWVNPTWGGSSSSLCSGFALPMAKNCPPPSELPSLPCDPGVRPGGDSPQSVPASAWHHGGLVSGGASKSNALQSPEPGPRCSNASQDSGKESENAVKVDLQSTFLLQK